RLIGPLSRGLDDDQVALGNNSFKEGNGRSATTLCSGTVSRRGAGGAGVGGSIRLSSRLADLSSALVGFSKGIGESFLVTTVGAFDGRVGATRGTRVWAGSGFSPFLYTDTGAA